MKSTVKISRKLTVYTILCSMPLLLIFISCRQELDIIPITKHTVVESFIGGPEGGSFSAINGSVLLQIPQNALKAQIKMRIEIGPEDYDNDFIIKSIVIYPKSVVFKFPVSLRLKYDGKLSNGSNLYDATSLAIYHFKNEAAFDKRKSSDMIWINKCFVNQIDYSIETEINSGGIFAIGEASLDQTVH